MRIAIVGVGALGGYIGGRLAAVGEAVAFIARGATLDALRSEGLRVETPEGDIVLTDVEATDMPMHIGPVDLVVVGVKAWQVPGIAEAMRPLVGESTTILPLQNGVEAPDQLAVVHGTGRVLGATCRIAAVRVAPAHVRRVDVGRFHDIALAALDDRPSERITQIVETLERAGIGARVPSDIHATLWKKFLFMAPVAGVGALTGVTMDKLQAVPETREMVRGATEEVLAVGTARGIRLSPELVDRSMVVLDDMPAGTTTSMQRDIIEGRPSELDALTGAVVRLARDSDVAVPINQFIYASLLPMEVRARASTV